MTPEPARTPVSVWRLSPASWGERAWGRGCIVAAVLFTATIFFLTAGLDFLSDRYPQLQLPMFLIDSGIAVLCGALLFKVMHDAQRRYRSLLQRLSLIADMNHHIRNALEQIEFSAHVTKDEQLRLNVHEAVMRIEWVLREVLPQEAGTDA